MSRHDLLLLFVGGLVGVLACYLWRLWFGALLPWEHEGEAPPE